MVEYHEPVMPGETIGALAVKPDGVYVDGTAGGGGHFSQIVNLLREQGTAVGIDRDPEAVVFTRARVGTATARVIVEQSRYSEFSAVLDKHGIGPIDGFLLDLGVSSHQIETPRRGFSYRQDAILDMRMNPEDPVTAQHLLNSATAEELTELLGAYGEIRNPARMAAAIVDFRMHHPLRTSGDLKECLMREYGANLATKVLAKIFQALRIAVNNELDELGRTLSSVTGRLKKQGRLVVISYHSLEDRIVKNFIREHERGCTCPMEVMQCRCGKSQLLKRLDKKAVRPRPEEIARNPRSRSARLRAALKTV